MFLYAITGSDDPFLRPSRVSMWNGAGVPRIVHCSMFLSGASLYRVVPVYFSCVVVVVALRRGCCYPP